MGGAYRRSLASVYGYRIHNSESCSAYGLYCPGFLVVIEGNDYRSVYFKDIKLKGNSSDVVLVDWSEVGVNDGILSTEIKGVDFGVNGDYQTSYAGMGTWVIIDLDSPGELRAYYEDEEGEKMITGMVDGEIVEDIPNSIYVPESETVYIFGDTREEITNGLKTQVVGVYEATYDLSISLSENDEEKVKFMADDILTNNQTTHQFSVDWEALEQGENGVTMAFDENEDGVFEKFIVSDESLSSPKAKLNSEKYLANEGAGIFFDGSASSDSDGRITLYEWDFDGDGTYDDTSFSSAITYPYGDDFKGEMFLRVTDDDGLKSISGAEVAVLNANPTVAISRFEMADVIDETIFGERSNEFRLAWHKF